MRKSITFLAPSLAAAAIGVAVGLAPIALADGHSAPVTKTPPVPTAPPQFETGVNPFVPSTGGDPYVLLPPGDGLAF